MSSLKRVALLVVLAGCRKAAPASPPPPEVTVLTVQPQTVPAKFEWVAQAAASKSVEVRAQVSGVIVARPYVEGTDVKKGTVLFRIDPRTYEANYESARARLAQAKATLANNARNLARLEPLLAERAVAQKDVDDARTAVEEAQAAVLDAQAAVRSAAHTKFRRRSPTAASSRTRAMSTSSTSRCNPRPERSSFEPHSPIHSIACCRGSSSGRSCSAPSARGRSSCRNARYSRGSTAHSCTSWARPPR